MSTGSQIWLPKAARAKTALQAHIDRALARGRDPELIRANVRGILRGHYKFPRLLETAVFDSLNFTHRPKGLKR